MTKEDLKREALKFLDNQVTAAVSTVSMDGEPQVSTVYYYADADLNFYFITAKGSKKLKNIEANKKVAIVVGFGPAPITIQAGGIAETNQDFKEEFIDKIFKKINFHTLDQLPFLNLEKEGLVIFKVKPTWLTFLNFDKEGHPDTYSQDFNKLI